MAPKPRKPVSSRTHTPSPAQPETLDQLNRKLDAIAQELYGKPYLKLNSDEMRAIDMTAAGETWETEETADPTGDAGTTAPDGENADTPDVNADGNGKTQISTVDVRAWAKAKGMKLPEHGRLPETVKGQYLAAYPDHEIVQVSGKGKTAKPLIPVPANAFDAEDVPQEEWESHPLEAPKPVRDETQVKVDTAVKSAYENWVNAGKPVIHDAPRKRYAVDPQYAPALRKMIRSAGTHHKVQVTIMPPRHGKDGREVIVFTAVDRPEKPKPETVIQEHNSPGSSVSGADPVTA